MLVYFFVIFSIITLLYFSGIFPFVSKNENSDTINTSFKINVSTYQPSYERSSFKAIYAQEVVESYFGWLVGFIVSLPFAYLISASSLPQNLIVASFLLMIMIVSAIHRKIPGVWRISEYVGHSAECIVFSRETAEPTKEIFTRISDRMSRGYTFFKGMRADEALKKLYNWKWLSNILVVILSFNIHRNGKI